MRKLTRVSLSRLVFYRYRRQPFENLNDLSEFLGVDLIVFIEYAYLFTDFKRSEMYYGVRITVVSPRDLIFNLFH